MRHGGLERAKKRLPLGVSTMRQLGSIGSFHYNIERINQLPDLRGTSSRLLNLLRQRWSDVPHIPQVN